MAGRCNTARFLKRKITVFIFFILISLYLLLLLTTRGGDEYSPDQDAPCAQTVPPTVGADGAGRCLYLVSIRLNDWGSIGRE